MRKVGYRPARNIDLTRRSAGHPVYANRDLLGALVQIVHQRARRRSRFLGIFHRVFGIVHNDIDIVGVARERGTERCDIFDCLTYRLLIGGDNFFRPVQDVTRGLHHVLTGAGIGFQGRRLTLFAFDQRRGRGNALERHGCNACQALKFEADFGVRPDRCRLIDRQHGDDLRRFVRIERQPGHFADANTVEQDIAAGQLWVADVDGVIAGAAAITTEQYPEYADVGLDISQPAIVVHRLAVDTKFRGMGIAAALLMQAEQESVNRGFNLLRIDTNSQNKAAQSLFPKLGYVFAGEMGLKFRPGMRFYCYEKRLG